MKTNNPEVIRIAKRAYPNYKGRKFNYEITDHPIDVRSYWDGGSRDYFMFMRLDTGATMPVPAQSAFDRPITGADRVQLMPGLVCIRHTYFCGKDLGLTILIHPENAPKFLPEPTCN